MVHRGRFFCFRGCTFASCFGRNKKKRINPEWRRGGCSRVNGQRIRPSSHQTTQHKMKTNKTKTQMTTMVDGLMTFGATDNGLHTLDFMCTECVEPSTSCAPSASRWNPSWPTARCRACATATSTSRRSPNECAARHSSARTTAR